MDVFINGKRVDLSSQEAPESKVVQHIPAGQVFEHDGSVEVSGDIGAGAVVKIKNGGIKVKGSVGDGAKIKVESSGTGNSGNVIIGRGNVVISGGRGISVSNLGSSFGGSSINIVSSGEDGITIEGVTGNKVTLVSNSSIKINNAGDHLSAKAGFSFVALLSVGSQAYVESGHNLALGDVGANSNLNSGHNMSLGNLGEDSRAVSGHNLSANQIGQNCQVNSGHNLSANSAHVTANVIAGHNKSVRNIIGASSPKSSAGTPPRSFDF